MPVYEYECQKCHGEYEATQRITDDPLEKCRDKECGGLVKRLISASTSFRLKGSGWYVDGYSKQAANGASG